MKKFSTTLSVFLSLSVLGMVTGLQSVAMAQVAGISASRTVDWTQVGIPGGIPSANWPIYKTLSPSGGADDSAAIQSAINSAPAGSVILLNPGTYKLNHSGTVCPGKSDDGGGGVYEAGLCLTDKSIVLRGSGPAQTILQYGGGANIVSLGRTFLSSSQISYITVTGGASKGSTQITLQSVSGISSGSYLNITQENPTDTDGSALVDPSGYGGCSYCGHDVPNHSMDQIDRVTGVSGNTVTLEKPLYYTFTNGPKAFQLNLVENVGLENLRVQSTASSGSNIEFKNIDVESCAHCWVHNVESDWAVDRSHIYLSDVYGSEVSNNYVYEAYNHNAGEDYAVFLEFRDSENLIQNNIIRRGRHSMVNVGGSGNVWAYNYILDPYMGEYHDALPENDTHGAYPYADLFEGNVTPNIELDNAHGNNGSNMIFRNYMDMLDINPDTNQPMTSGMYALSLAYGSDYENVVGNVIGPYGSSCKAGTYEINTGSSQGSAIYKFGFYDDGGTAAPNSTLAAKVPLTLIRGGNWDCVTNSVIWSNNVPGGNPASTYLAQQTLPASLYLSGKPSWFTAAGATWPAIDPTAGTKVNLIPAQICYNNTVGAGRAYDPASCYGGSGNPTPSPAPTPTPSPTPTPTPSPTPVPTDTTPPAIVITSPANGATLTGSTLKISGTASDNTAVTSVKAAVDGGAFASVQGTTTWSFSVPNPTSLSSGNHTITVKASDAAGNSVQASIVITVQIVTPTPIPTPTPTPSPSPTPTPVCTPPPVAFGCTATLTNSATCAYTLNCPPPTPTPVPTPTPTPTPTPGTGGTDDSTQVSSFTRWLSHGSSGSEVYLLQLVLVKDGDYPAAIRSGFFGTLTQAAVQTFQMKYGIVSLGSPTTTGFGAVGSRTRAKLNALLAGGILR